MQAEATWVRDVEQALLARPSSLPALPTGVAILFDAATEDTLAALDQASRSLQDLSIVTILTPEDCTRFDELVRSVCVSLGIALQARAGFLAAFHHLAGATASDAKN